MFRQEKYIPSNSQSAPIVTAGCAELGSHHGTDTGMSNASLPKTMGFSPGVRQDAATIPFNARIGHAQTRMRDPASCEKRAIDAATESAIPTDPQTATGVRTQSAFPPKAQETPITNRQTCATTHSSRICSVEGCGLGFTG